MQEISLKSIEFVAVPVENDGRSAININTGEVVPIPCLEPIVSKNN